MVGGLIGALLFGASLAALWFAAVRLVSPVAGDGLERVLAAASAVAGAAVLEALALGLVDLGTNALALTLASAGLWVAARLLLPAPALAPSAELARWWTALDPGPRMAAGAGLGLLAAWSAWVLVEPALDIDGLAYHLPEIAAWVSDGTPGSIETVVAEFPVGYYPVTNEVLLAWAGGLSHNIGVLLLWAPLSAALLGAAFVLGVRCYGAGAVAALAGVAALLLVPMVGDGATRIGTDLASTVWLAVGAALALRSTQLSASPRLLAFAVVALGLAIGTKTSIAPLGLIVLAVALWRLRRRLPAAHLVAAAVVATAVGGVWYIRNLIDNGSPLWPFVSFPGSDPLPPGFDAADSSFIDQPIATLDGKLGDYLELLGPAPLLFVVAIAVCLMLRRSRGFLLALAALLIGAFAWMNAPLTGDTGALASDLFAVSTVRYLMPTVALAIAILAVAADRPGPAARLARAALAVGIAWGLVDLALGRDGVPAIWLLALGGGLGAALVAAQARLAAAAAMRPRGAWLVAAAAGAALVVALAAYPSRYLERFAAAPGEVDDPLTDARATFAPLVRWFEEQPGFSGGEAPVLFHPTVVGPLAGGDLRHELTLVRADADCAGLDAGLGRNGYLVVRVLPATFGPPPALLDCFGPRRELMRLPVEGGGSLVVLGPELPD